MISSMCSMRKQDQYLGRTGCHPPTSATFRQESFFVPNLRFDSERAFQTNPFFYSIYNLIMACALPWLKQHVGGLCWANTPPYSFAHVAYSHFLPIIQSSFNWKTPGQAELMNMQQVSQQGLFSVISLNPISCGQLCINTARSYRGLMRNLLEQAVLRNH